MGEILKHYRISSGCFKGMKYMIEVWTLDTKFHKCFILNAIQEMTMGFWPKRKDYERELITGILTSRPHFRSPISSHDWHRLLSSPSTSTNTQVIHFFFSPSCLVVFPVNLLPVSLFHASVSYSTHQRLLYLSFSTDLCFKHDHFVYLNFVMGRV